MFGFEGTADGLPCMILDSSMVEHTAVNRVVVGSSPTRGAKKNHLDSLGEIPKGENPLKTGLRGQEVKTSPFHGGNTGSIPVGVIFEECVIP